LHQFNCDSLDIVLFVNLTRDDLRDECAMADEAFALSPISARAAQPRDEDYDAIREAFMETSRGRWFLGEYAKRNRNADTRMVLDAVARIEETVAAQRKPDSDAGLAEALIGIRAALEDAWRAASAAMDDLGLAENLAPVRKGARVIREIAWRLREIGADGRICDLIDSQVDAIEGASGKLAAIDPAAGLNAAFDLIEQRIAEFDESEASASPPHETSKPEASWSRATEEAESLPARAAYDVAAVAVDQTASAASAATASAASEPEAAIIDPAMTAEPIVETAEAVSESAELPDDAGDAYDEAVLDLVALEMAAADPAGEYDEPEHEADGIEAYGIEAAEPEPAEPEPAEPPPAEPIVIAKPPEPIAAPAVQPLPEPSLGSSLIANGIVQRPRTSKPDPLAPIRRMSQTEKIAFFS
jgi:hypothetical protein